MKFALAIRFQRHHEGRAAAVDNLTAVHCNEAIQVTLSDWTLILGRVINFMLRLITGMATMIVFT